MRPAVLLDIGHSIDDFFAVALAACSPELDLVGVTTAADDTGVRAQVVRTLLDAYGRAEVPVARGDGPSPRAAFFASWLKEGAPASVRARLHVAPPPAVDFMRDALVRRGPLTLVVVGPLTNVAGLLRRWPELAGRIDHVYFAGGWLTQALPEHNVRLDPEAAADVLRFGIPLTAFGYEVTRGYRLLSTHQAQLAAAPTLGAATLYSLYDAWCKADGVHAPGILDPLVVTHLCGQAAAQFEAVQVAIATEGPGRGTMYRVKEGGHTIHVATRIDGSRYIDFLVSRVAAKTLAPHAAAGPDRWTVEVRAAYHLNHYPNWSLSRVQHVSHTLAIVRAGGAEATVGDANFRLEAGCALYVPSGVTLSLTSPGGMSAFWLYFDVFVKSSTGRLEPLARLPWPHRFAPVAERDVWLAAARRVEQYWLHPRPEASLLGQAALLEIIADLCTRSYEQALRQRGPFLEAAERAKHWIETRVTEPVTLDEIAEHVNLSKYYLLRIFREAFGMPPLQYHRRLRLEYARRLLRLQHLSVREVAEKVGYESTTAFTRAFKREFGTTPTEEQGSL